jgi:hypothetical protein
LILESAAFSEIVFGSAKRQYRRREESRIWSLLKTALGAGHGVWGK